MSILTEILADVPAAPSRVEEVRVGPFQTAVQVAGLRPPALGAIARCGLASSMARHDPGEDHAVDGVGRLTLRSPQELARWLLSTNPLQASIGMATLNALLDVPPSCLDSHPAQNLILKRARGRRVAVLGHFPFIGRLSEEAEELHVLELRPGAGESPATRASKILPRCEVVVLTATVLMNGTHEHVLPLCAQAFTLMLGPSTPPSPALFRWGMDVLAGSIVTDPESVLRTVSQGGTYRDLEGVRKWSWIQSDG